MKKYMLQDYREISVLRNFIKEALLLSEDYDGSYDYYMSDIGMGGGGGGGGGGDGGPVFITAFTDVFKTAAAESDKMLQRTKTLTNNVFQALMSSVNPFYKADYGKVFALEKQRIGQIQSKYADVYARTNKAFEDNDFAWAAAICSPETFLTAKFVKQAPDAAKNLAGLVPGGDKLIQKLSESNRFMYLRLNEEKKKKREKDELTPGETIKNDARETLNQFLAEVISTTEQWKKVGSMNLQQFEKFVSEKSKDTQQASVNIKQVLDQQKKSWQDEMKKSGKEMGDAAQSIKEQEWTSSFLSKIPEEVVGSVKKMLQKRIEEAKSGGAPDDCWWIQKHIETMSKI